MNSNVKALNTRRFGDSRLDQKYVSVIQGLLTLRAQMPLSTIEDQLGALTEQLILVRRRLKKLRLLQAVSVKSKSRCLNENL